ncbi:MAG: hypothetical protein ACJ8DI_07475, partial [Ktedonobacteraceae bacterium]
VCNRSSVLCSVADGRARFRAIAHLLLNHTSPLVYHLHTRFATLEKNRQRMREKYLHSLVFPYPEDLVGVFVKHSPN